MHERPHDGRFPVSIKAVLIHVDRVVLLRNERNEWGLPGGRLEPGESPEDGLKREIREELGAAATIGPILDCWVYPVLPDRPVVIVTYGAMLPRAEGLAVSDEHSDLRLAPLGEIDRLPMPEGYRRSIRRWWQILTDSA